MSVLFSFSLLAANNMNVSADLQAFIEELKERRKSFKFEKYGVGFIDAMIFLGFNSKSSPPHDFEPNFHLFTHRPFLIKMLRLGNSAISIPENSCPRSLSSKFYAPLFEKGIGNCRVATSYISGRLDALGIENKEIIISRPSGESCGHECVAHYGHFGCGRCFVYHRFNIYKLNNCWHVLDFVARFFGVPLEIALPQFNEQGFNSIKYYSESEGYQNPYGEGSEVEFWGGPVPECFMRFKGLFSG
jgi:hypothetical protein